jgi:hypothetical protein
MYFTSNSLGTEIGKIITVKKNKVYDLKMFNSTSRI